MKKIILSLGKGIVLVFMLVSTIGILNVLYSQDINTGIPQEYPIDSSQKQLEKVIINHDMVRKFKEANSSIGYTSFSAILQNSSPDSLRFALEKYMNRVDEEISRAIDNNINDSLDSIKRRYPDNKEAYSTE